MCTYCLKFGNLKIFEIEAVFFFGKLTSWIWENDISAFENLTFGSLEIWILKFGKFETGNLGFGN